jgi:acyl-CoA thioesterase FadM
MDSIPPFRCVTASLHVDYLRPTPLDGKLKLEATVKNIDGKRVNILVELFGGGKLCAKGEVVAVAVGEKWLNRWVSNSD